MQEQGGLADAGFAAKQYRRPWHKPVAQDMIQGPDAAFIGLMPLAGNLAQGYGRIVRIILLYSAFLLDKLKGDSIPGRPGTAPSTAGLPPASAAFCILNELLPSLYNRLFGQCIFPGCFSFVPTIFARPPS